MRKATIGVAATAALALGAGTAYASQPTPPSVSTTRAHLAKIVVRTEYSANGYVHDPWGMIGSCNTWWYIVRRDATYFVDDPNPLADPCRVLGGKWRDTYTGKSYVLYGRQMGMLAVEHIVSLHEAYQSGMKYFTAAKRRRLANDPREMVISTDATNIDKGAWDIKQWLPPLASFRCRYARLYIDIKYRYGLKMNPTEKTAAYRVLKRWC